MSLWAGTVIGFVSVKDKTFSQLPYSGVAPGASVIFSIKRKQNSQIVNIDFQKGKLTTAYNHIGSSSYKYINANYSYLKNIYTTSASSFQLKAGPAIGFLYSSRSYDGLINNNRGREVIIDVKAAAESSLHVKAGNGSVIIVNLLQLPLAAAVAQPVYGADAWQVPVSEKSALNEVINNTKLLTLPALFRISNRFSAQYFFKQAHSISCSYFFDYLNSKDKREQSLTVNQIAIYYGYTF